MDLALEVPLDGTLEQDDESLACTVVWLDTGRAHALCTRRLKASSEWSLAVQHAGATTGLTVRVLAVRVRSEIKSGPRVLHLCSIDVPPDGLADLESLLRAVNPSVAPPEHVPEPAPEPEPVSESSDSDLGWDDLEPAPEPEPESAPEPDPEPDPVPPVGTFTALDGPIQPGPSREELAAEEERARRARWAAEERENLRRQDHESPRRSTRADPDEDRPRRKRPKDVPRRTTRRLPPQRRLSSHIPRASPGQPDPEPRRERPAPPKAPSERKKGLRTAELVVATFQHGTPPMVTVAFTSTELWRRSARSGQGWLQLTLADLDEVPDQQDVALDLTLPTGVNVHAIVQVARRGRGRMILEGRGLPESTQDALGVMD